MINTDDYFYRLTVSEDLLTRIKQIVYPSVSTYKIGIEKHLSAKGIPQLLDSCNLLTSLLPYIDDFGLIIKLPPGESTGIHVDGIDLLENKQVGNRNIAINFPILMCDSITSFYKKPDAKSHYFPGWVSNGIYIRPPTPICSFSMDNNAMLVNTRVYHNVTNLSSSDTRIILSFSFNTKYNMVDCIEIMQNLGYSK